MRADEEGSRQGGRGTEQELKRRIMRKGEKWKENKLSRKRKKRVRG